MEIKKSMIQKHTTNYSQLMREGLCLFNNPSPNIPRSNNKVVFGNIARIGGNAGRQHILPVFCHECFPFLKIPPTGYFDKKKKNGRMSHEISTHYQMTKL